MVLAELVLWWLVLMIEEVCISRESAWYVVMLMLVMNNVLREMLMLVLVWMH